MYIFKEKTFKRTISDFIFIIVDLY